MERNSISGIVSVRTGDSHAKLFSTPQGGAMEESEESGSTSLQWTDLPWKEVSARVLAECTRQLKDCRQVQPGDVCQEVLVCMQGEKFAKRFDPARSSFWAYVSGVCRHHCAQAVRKCVRRRTPSSALNELLPLAAQSAQHDPSRQAERVELAAAVARCRESLSPTDQAALDRLLGYVHGTRHAGVGRTSTRHVQELRCRRRLAELLRRYL